MEIPTHLLVQPPGFNAIKFGEIAVEHDPFAAKQENGAFDSFHRNN